MIVLLSTSVSVKHSALSKPGRALQLEQELAL